MNENKSAFGIFIGGGISRSRYPNGHSVSYAGPPFFSGDLKVEYKSVPAFLIGVNQERSFGKRGFTSIRSISFSSVGYLTALDYDYANSLNNIVSSERSFHYMAINQGVKFKFRITEKISVAPTGSVFLSYLTKSKETNTNYFGGDLVSREVNYLPDEKRFNYGYEAGLSTMYKTTKLDYEIQWIYRLYYEPNYRAYDKQAYVLAFSLGIIFNK